jgi:L-ascorbate metabolism protein UlaG (beta-lactamase superfamily)
MVITTTVTRGRRSGLAISRRTVFASGAPLLLSGAAYAVYKQAPVFWDQFGEEMFMQIAKAPAKPDPKKWPEQGLHVAWLGHATTLIQIDGFRILTDPVFSNRCGIDLLVGTLGPKRLVEPALMIPELPKIDLVLLSHAHFDHWDMPTLRQIAGKDVPVICARETQDLLTHSRWKSVRELGWREVVEVGPVKVRATEVKHWGARVRRDTHRGYNGYLIESGRYKVLFSGDTAYTTVFKELKGGRPIDVAVMPIGAYNPWITNHCTPEQAIEMANWAGAERIMPVHHQTFVLSREPVQEPIERFWAKVGPTQERAVAHTIGSEWSVIT